MDDVNKDLVLRKEVVSFESGNQSSVFLQHGLHRLLYKALVQLCILEVAGVRKMEELSGHPNNIDANLFSSEPYQLKETSHTESNCNKTIKNLRVQKTRVN